MVKLSPAAKAVDVRPEEQVVAASAMVHVPIDAPPFFDTVNTQSNLPTPGATPIATRRFAAVTAAPTGMLIVAPPFGRLPMSETFAQPGPVGPVLPVAPVTPVAPLVPLVPAVPVA